MIPRASGGLPRIAPESGETFISFVCWAVISPSWLYWYVAIVDWEIFGEEKVSRVYLAGRLREAKNVESILTQHGINYAVEIEPFTTYLFGFIRREHKGVAFYV